MTKQEAQALADELHLDEQDARTLRVIYVNHAMGVEDLIVAADPEINLLKEVKALGKLKEEQIENLLSEENYKLYKYKEEQSIVRQESEFDSLQMYFNDPEFNEAVLNYFDENVSPYLIYYHQTYFKPALKQKHYFKINQDREKLNEHGRQLDSIKLATGKRFEFDAVLEDDLENTLKDLKRLRKKYIDRLDYINVSMGPVVREWNADYIKMVQEYYKDDVYQQIDEYSKYLNAYGINYIVGQFSLLLFDVYEPRGYVEGRDILIEMLRSAN
ncbi:MAG: hypothetical protein R2728_07815 [Chitinophagales bacterium]